MKSNYQSSIWFRNFVLSSIDMVHCHKFPRIPPTFSLPCSRFLRLEANYTMHIVIRKPSQFEWPPFNISSEDRLGHMIGLDPSFMYPQPTRVIFAYTLTGRQSNFQMKLDTPIPFSQRPRPPSRQNSAARTKSPKRLIDLLLGQARRLSILE